MEKSRLETTLDGIRISRTLDVATGAGNYASFLRTNIKGCGAITAIDVDRTMLTRAKEHLDKIADVSPACMNSAMMAFKPEAFDMVCISNSLHHMSKLEDTLAEMLRVLRPGGYFLVSEMFRDGQTDAQMTHVLMHEWWAEIDTALGVSHNGTFRKDEILDICAIPSLGLENMISQDYAFLDKDPLDPEAVEYIDGAIDMYVKKASGLDNFENLKIRGDELRERLHSTGFHGATTLVILGSKSA
ncbi:MAG: class I SAM-dependent methyltransferase [Candidatus Aegiribacteria sp.]|nr:class I SAM-dependent methyltransferase [Candidatus Aegiribacteria sp.]